MLQFITDFGDLAFLVPASLLVLGYLAYLRARPSAIAWASAFAACALLTALLKVSFMTCGEKISSLNIYTPSGHTSVATTFYLGIGLLISRNRSPSVGLIVIAVVVGLTAAIAASRALLGYHSVGEVVIGLIVGIICVTGFAAKYYGKPQPGLPLAPALGLLVVLTLFAHGRQMSQESWFRAIANYIRIHYALCA